jgi:uncharacterized protein (DUF849 family)
MIPTKDLNEFVPVTPDEIVEDAIRVYDAGARIVHLHARDEDGKPTWKASAYEPILANLRRECPGLVLCVTTSGRNWSSFEQRSEVLHLSGDAKPDFASLTLGSMNFPTGPSVNSTDMIVRLAQTMTKQGIRPEFEAFEVGMLGVARLLERKGIVTGRRVFNLLLGNLGTLPATLGNLSTMVAALPEDSFWAAAGIGTFQLPMNTAAIVGGGGVRVGIEDSMFYDYAKTAKASNEGLVRRIVRIAEEMQRPIATPEQTRALVGLA